MAWKLFLAAILYRSKELIALGSLGIFIVTTFLKIPLKFLLGPQDIMIPGTPFDGPMLLTGRIDADGDARVDAGDIEGFVKVKPGDKNVELFLNHLTEG